MGQLSYHSFELCLFNNDALMASLPLDRLARADPKLKRYAAVKRSFHGFGRENIKTDNGGQ